MKVNTSRAIVFHAHTLEVLEELEIPDQLRTKGLRRAGIYDGVLAVIHFMELPSHYPFTLIIPQNVTEAILLARL